MSRTAVWAQFSLVLIRLLTDEVSDQGNKDQVSVRRCKLYFYIK